MAKLIELLEAATGPSLDLDGRVWCAVNELEFVMWDGAGCVYKDPAAPSWDRGIKHSPASLVRPYTASIDAAVALVERKLPGAWYLIGKGRTRSDEPLYGVQLLFGSDEIIGEGEHDASPAIALCLALLRSLPQSSAPDRGEG